MNIALCRFGDSLPAVVRLSTPQGCIRYPDDREQDLCLQHLIKDGMVGPTEVLSVYRSDLLGLL